jgi:uncharacterized delta-60 repeat protein
MVLRFISLILISSLSLVMLAQNPGSLNPEFNTLGWDSIYGNNNGLETHKVLVQPNGQIVYCAEANFSNEGHQGIVVRYNTDGSLDTSFGSDGVVRTKDDDPIDMYTRASGFALQSDGKMIIAGDQFYNTERIIRLNTDGTLDTSFGENGVVDFNRPNSEFIYHANVQSDDKILISGRGDWMVNGVFEKHVFIWRLLADGSLDTSFGTDGLYLFASTEWMNGFENYLILDDVIVLEDDNILLNMTFTNSNGTCVLLKKLLPNGTPDTSFASNSEWLKLHPTSNGNYTYSSVCILENGAILCTSTPYNPDTFSYSGIVHALSENGIENDSFQLTIYEGQYFSWPVELRSFGNVFFVLMDQLIDNYIKEMRCYDITGNPVTEFGENGLSLINSNNIPSLGSAHFDVAPSGQLYLAAPEIGGESNDVYLVMANLIGTEYEPISDVESGVIPTWKLFPCPADQFIILENIELNSSFTILNESGQIVKTIKRATSSTMLVDVSSLAAGAYIVLEKSGGVHKFVVAPH